MKKLLYHHNDGFNAELQNTDETSLGKITLIGIAGEGLDVGNNRIINVGPSVDPSDAVNKAYVDNAVALFTATQIGQTLLSVDGSSFSRQLPLTSIGPDGGGWLVNNSGTLLVAG